MTKRFGYLIALCFSIGSYAQTNVKEITKEDYLMDFDVMTNLIKKQHPNPFRFIDEKTFDSQVKELRHRLEESPTYGSFFMNNPITLIKDAHSSAFPDMTLYADYVKTINFFPLQAIVFNERVYVNQHTKEIPAGAEIILINDEEVSEIIKQIHIASDAFIPASNNVYITTGISFLNPTAKEYKIVYEYDGEVKSVTMPSTNFDRYYYNSAKCILPIDAVSENWLIHGRQLNADTYFLTLRSFNLSEEYAYYYLNKIFKDLKDSNVKNLIIDIRSNSGGLLSNIPLYYSFISKDKLFKNNYRYATKVVDVKMRNYLIDENERQVSASDIVNLDNFMHQRFEKDEKSDYYYGNNRLDESYIENYPQDKNAFTGNVTLLINSETISAATYFASLFKENNRGVIVGSETTTCSNFTTAAWFLNYKLPQTGFLVNIPRSEVFFNDLKRGGQQDCRGVIPDFTVSNEAFQKAIIDVEDPDIALALRILDIEKDKKSK